MAKKKTTGTEKVVEKKETKKKNTTAVKKPVKEIKAEEIKQEPIKVEQSVDVDTPTYITVAVETDCGLITKKVRVK